MHFNCYCSSSFEPEIIKIGQSSHKMYSNNIVNIQESTTILNAHTKKIWKLIVCTSYIYIYIYVCVCVCGGGDDLFFKLIFNEYKILG